MEMFFYEIRAIAPKENTLPRWPFLLLHMQTAMFKGGGDNESLRLGPIFSELDERK